MRDGRCAYLGPGEFIQLQFEECDREDPEQKWRFYYACSGKIVQVVRLLISKSIASRIPV